MHQYFADKQPVPGTRYVFSREQAHHIRDVLRMSGETIRLVYEGKGYEARTGYEGGTVFADVIQEDHRYNELPADITLCMALIRKEKMELILQKAAELGAVRIVPFESSRCVAKVRMEKWERVKERWNTILLEGSQQCKRNRIPELTDPVPFAKICDYRSEGNAACWEKAGCESLFLSQLPHAASYTIVIGPEGGFSPQEMTMLDEYGFTAVTLGSRILRAETAVFYALSVLGEKAQREQK